MAEDKTQLSLNEEQSQIPDAGIQEQIKLDADAPVLERTTGNVIDISGDLIDKLMSQQTAHEDGIPAETPAKEGGQEWEKPQEQPEPPRRGRRPKNKEAPARGARPARQGRPP
ncbi:MAG: hypothetical protein K1W21_08480, partial [Oscillospiraceae bacterium]